MSDVLLQRAKALHLHGLAAHWAEVVGEAWLPRLLDWEEAERTRRSLERRTQAAKIGAFKPLCDFVAFPNPSLTPTKKHQGFSVTSMSSAGRVALHPRGWGSDGVLLDTSGSRIDAERVIQVA